MKNFLLSLKTTVWALVALIALFFVGSYLMPAHRALFTPMNEDLLVVWASRDAVGAFEYTWWFFAAVAVLVLLTANTVACSLQAIKGKWSRADFLLRIAPQAIHLGFLLILVAHFVSAGWGYKLSGMMPEGAYAPLPDDLALRLGQIRVERDAEGFRQDWSAEATVYKNNHPAKTGELGPNRPLFYRGVGVYLQSVSLQNGPAAVLLIAKDPGAPWALAGGVLFLLGSGTLLALKGKKG